MSYTNVPSDGSRVEMASFHDRDMCVRCRVCTRKDLSRKTDRFIFFAEVSASARRHNQVKAELNLGITPSEYFKPMGGLATEILTVASAGTERYVARSAEERSRDIIFPTLRSPGKGDEAVMRWMVNGRATSRHTSATTPAAKCQNRSFRASAISRHSSVIGYYWWCRAPRVGCQVDPNRSKTVRLIQTDPKLQFCNNSGCHYGSHGISATKVVVGVVYDAR